MVSDERLKFAVELAQAGKHTEAEKIYRVVLRDDPSNLAAWVGYSNVAADLPERIHALERAVALCPGNSMLEVRLETLRRELPEQEPQQVPAYTERKTGPPSESMPFLLQRGKVLEDRGKFEAAIEIYTNVITYSRSPAERVEATRRIEDIRTRQEADKIQRVHPTLNLLRLATGPVLLFIIMVFVQSGLNPLHTPLLSLLGIASVAVGSLMISITEMRPVHPAWVNLFGKPGAGEEPEMRKGIRLLGWALLLAPYSMFLMDAGQRLVTLQSSMLGK